MDYVYFHLFLFVLLTTYTTDIQGYDFQCPTNAHWNLRSRIRCNDTIDRYTCLFKYSNIGITFEETCNGPELNREGFKRVMRPRYFDNEPCPSSHFQPLRFTSVGNTECFFQKSLCSEEGQIEYSPGSTTTDRFCRCDYTKGYAFVTKPNNPCFCDPHNEDCSCYRKPCKDSVLSADYECITIYTLEYPTSCPSIQTFRPQEVDVISRHDETEDQGFEWQFFFTLRKLQEKDTFVKSVIGTLVLGFIILLLRLSFGEWYVPDEDIVSIRLENAICIINQPVIFMCKLKRRVPQPYITWTHDNNIIMEDDQIKIKQHGKMHILQIRLTTLDKAGIYKFSVKGYFFEAISEARLIVIEATMNGAKYLSIAQVMQTKATEVVRTLFDKIFSSENIQKGNAFDRHKLEELKRKNIITNAEMRNIIPGLVREYDPSSNAFEIRLMIKLIRNFTTFTIIDYLPTENEVGISAELSRLKYYKNQVVHMDPGELDAQNYSYLNSMLVEINSAVKRLEDEIEKFDPGTVSSIQLGETNFLRFYLLCKMSTDALRYFFDRHVPPEHLHNHLKTHEANLRGKWKCYPPELKVLFPDVPLLPQSTNFDVSLLYKLIRNTLLIPPPAQGWGKEPLTSDISETDDVERVRKFRNLMVHNESCKLADYVFHTYWTELSEAIRRLSYGSLTSEVDKLKHKHLGQENMNEMQQGLFQHRKEIRDFQQEIRDLRRRNIGYVGGKVTVGTQT